MNLNYTRTNIIDRLNRKDPTSAEVGLGDLLEEIIQAINFNADRVFTVFPDWKAWQLPYNVLAVRASSVTTAHTPVISSVVNKLNSATGYLISSSFKGSASVLANVATATISSSSAAPLTNAANSSAALTITTGDMPAAIGPACTSYNAAMTAINSAVTLQTGVLIDAIARINMIGNHFASNSAQYTVGGVVLSAAWSSLSTPVTATVAFSNPILPLSTAVTTVTTVFSAVQDMITAQNTYHDAHQRLNATLCELVPALNSATFKANQMVAFLTASTHENSAAAAAAVGVTSNLIASSAVVPFTVASVTTAMSALTALTTIESLVTRYE